MTGRLTGGRSWPPVSRNGVVARRRVRYLPAVMKRIVEVKALASYRVWLRFEDGVEASSTFRGMPGAGSSRSGINIRVSSPTFFNGHNHRFIVRNHYSARVGRLSGSRSIVASKSTAIL